MSANTTSGFSIVNWNGTEASATVAHGLSQAPEIIIVKDVDSDRSWPVSTENTTGTVNGYLLLNTDASESSSVYYWGAAPGASVFTLGDSANTNDDASMIAYCFHSVKDYSKVGMYVGNGNANGPFIYTGFRPAYIWGKWVDGNNDWWIQDNKREGYNITEERLKINGSTAQENEYGVDLLSNGVKIGSNTGGIGQSGRKFLYMAFAESPFKTANAR